jgi:hypothetical protein
MLFYVLFLIFPSHSPPHSFSLFYSVFEECEHYYVEISMQRNSGNDKIIIEGCEYLGLIWWKIAEVGFLYPISSDVIPSLG